MNYVTFSPLGRAECAIRTPVRRTPVQFAARAFSGYGRFFDFFKVNFKIFPLDARKNSFRSRAAGRSRSAHALRPLGAHMRCNSRSTPSNGHLAVTAAMRTNIHHFMAMTTRA